MSVTINQDRLHLYDKDNTARTDGIAIDVWGGAETFEDAINAALTAKSGEIGTYINTLSMIAALGFSESKNYNIGDYVLGDTRDSNNVVTYFLYRFIKPHAAGAWNSNEVAKINLSEEVKINEQALADGNVVDLVSMLVHHGTGVVTNHGSTITCTWNDQNICTFEGTLKAKDSDGNTYAYYHLWFPPQSIEGNPPTYNESMVPPYVCFPNFVKPGQVYGIIFDTISNNTNITPQLDFSTTTDGITYTGHRLGSDSTSIYFTTGTYAIIPDDAIGMKLRVRIINSTDSDITNLKISVKVHVISLNGELAIQPTEPTSVYNRLWIPTGDTREEVQVPSWEEFSAVKTVTDKSFIPLGALPFANTPTDLNEVVTEGYYLLTGGINYPNLPWGTARTNPTQLEVLKTSSNRVMQRVTDPTTGEIFIRQSNKAGDDPTFENVAWKKSIAEQDVEDDLRSYGLLPAGDLNEAKTPGYYLISTGIEYTNIPEDQLTSGGLLEVFKTTNNFIFQRLVFNVTKNEYIRRSTSGSFSGVNWTLLNGGRKLQKKYVAFGDSLTVGQVWNSSPGGTTHQTANEYRIPTRIARALGAVNNYDNQALGGAGYVYKGNQGAEPNIVEIIKDYDFSDTEIVTIMGGANDKLKSWISLGSTASTAGDGTICGAIKEIIAWFKDNPTTDNDYKKALQKIQLIFIQPLPSGRPPEDNPWTTPGYSGGWSMNDFDKVVSEICRAEHVGYVNWTNCTYCDTWAERNVGYSPTSGPNYTHPIVDEDYALLGDFIAGKVASYGQNYASIPVPPTTEGAYNLTATVSSTGAVSYNWTTVN